MPSRKQMLREARESEWDVVRLPPPLVPEPLVSVRRRAPSGARWEPWVIAARSAILAAVRQPGRGLYAARPFKRGDVVGKYAGEVVGRFESRAAALASREADALVRAGHDKLITRHVSGQRGVELVDGASGGPPFLHYINDPRGTRLKPNVGLTDHGYIVVVQEAVPAFDLSKPIEENAKSELRFSYGSDDYWALVGRIGTSPDYAIDLG